MTDEGMTRGEEAEARRAAGRVDDSILNWSHLTGDLARVIAEHPWRFDNEHSLTMLCGCGLLFENAEAWAGHLAAQVEELLWGYQDDGVNLTADERLREALRLADGYPVVGEDQTYDEVRNENLTAAQAHAAIAQALFMRQMLGMLRPAPATTG